MAPQRCSNVDLPQPDGPISATNSPAAAANDTLVNPQRNTVQLATALQRAGVATTLKVYDGTNHFTLLGAMAAPLRFLAPLLDDAEAFVKAG